MAYCTQADVERKAGGAERLRYLADWDQDGNPDADVISDAIAEVSARINSYAGKKRKVAFAEPVPDIVRWTCAAEVVFVLKQARNAADGADTDKAELELHQERVEWLKALAKGTVTLGVDPAPTAATEHAHSEYSERSGEYSRDDFEGFA